MTTPQDIADRWPAIAAAFNSEGVIIGLPQALNVLPKLATALAGQPVPATPIVPGLIVPSLATVQIVNAPDVRNWSETAKITRIAWDGTTTYIAHTKQDGTGAWPNVRPAGWAGDLQDTVWLFLFMPLRKQWVGSAFIQRWRGMAGSGSPADPDIPRVYHQHWYYGIRWSPLQEHGPIIQGEPIGLMVTSGNCRDSAGPFGPMERSNLVVVPAADVAEYRWAP